MEIINLSIFGSKKTKNEVKENTEKVVNDKKKVKPSKENKHDKDNETSESVKIDSPKKKDRKPKTQISTILSNLSIEDTAEPSEKIDKSEKINSKPKIAKEKKENVFVHLNLNTDKKHDAVEKQKADMLSIEKDTMNGFFRILQEFNNEYPAKTNIHCWWCTFEFDTHPVGIPRKYDKKKNVFSVIGCFCSFSCVLAFVYDTRHNSQSLTESCTLDFITTMYRKVSGDTSVGLVKNKLKPSPSRFTLKKFGGNLSIEEFRDSFNNEKKFEIMIAPMVPWAMICSISGGSNKYMKNGIMKTLEIRKSVKKDRPETIIVESSAVKQRTSIQQMISYT